MNLIISEKADWRSWLDFWYQLEISLYHLTKFDIQLWSLVFAFNILLQFILNVCKSSLKWMTQLMTLDRWMMSEILLTNPWWALNRVSYFQHALNYVPLLEKKLYLIKTQVILLRVLPGRTPWIFVRRKFVLSVDVIGASCKIFKIKS